MGEEIESQSAVCIRILQAHRWVGNHRRRTRHEVRKEPVGIHNHIQQLCWPENDAYTAADVDFVSFVNDKDIMEGLISIGKRDEKFFEDDCLVGAILAFVTGVTKTPASPRRNEREGASGHHAASGRRKQACYGSTNGSSSKSTKSRASSRGSARQG